jgi:OOP family OmpA-OmpF porin
MSDDRAAGPEPPPGENGDGPTDLAAVRRILVGPERLRIDQLEAELEARRLTPAELAEHLPEAIALRGVRDRQIGRALAPTVETALRESIRRNPREIAAAIFPVLGPAIRKAIAETMSALVRSINSAVEHSLTPQGIRWRLEAWRTGVPYAQVVIRHALVYRVEQAFLIHAETGLLLEHATAPGLDLPDADLISGMLTAIQDFVRDSFRPGEGAVLRTFTVGEHTVQVEAGPLALLALVIRGQAPASVLLRQQDILETIHVQFTSQLEEFTGDATSLRATHPLLEECLETVVDPTTGRPRRLAWMRWVVPATLALLVVIVMVMRSRARFAQAVAALDAEPGLVVVDAERSSGRWEVRGLRDPQARTPDAVLAGAGLDPSRLTGRWEAYASLDSTIVVARARQAFALPQSSAITLAGDTLVLSGDLPTASLGRIARGVLPSGVAMVDASAARLVLTPGLDSLRMGIESARILFAPGSADLSAAAAALAQRVGRDFTQLASGIAEQGGDIRLSLVGRTDPTGSAETNQALAQWRVERVASLLSAAGVPLGNVRQEAVATARPLPAGTADDASRINRSVSFEITVSTGRSPGGR